jgi:hypothetical protein
MSYLSYFARIVYHSENFESDKDLKVRFILCYLSGQEDSATESADLIISLISSNFISVFHPLVFSVIKEPVFLQFQ